MTAVVASWPPPPSCHSCNSVLPSAEAPCFVVKSAGDGRRRDHDRERA
ncbi:MAG: hypothetical protein MZU79_03095 [Anaerotruncus sp.]|nr:hypothetical protein [Anaerotruncus sp.]